MTPESPNEEVFDHDANFDLFKGKAMLLQRFGQTTPEVESSDWDDAFMIVFMVKTVVTCSLSSLCVLLNSLLIFFVLTTKEFCNLKFAPVVIQAFVDIIGPGIANFIYEILALKETRREEVAKKLSEILQMADFIRPMGALACVTTFLRVILNEYTTGSCVLATAFIRYVLVCHPTRNIIKRPLLILILIAIVAIPIIAIGVQTYKITEETIRTDGGEIISLGEFGVSGSRRQGANKIHYRCDTIYYRDMKRTIIEMGICLALPAFLSGCFYLLIGVALIRRNHSSVRNRNLTFAFFLSWVLWLICWAPYYWGMHYELFDFAEKDRYRQGC